MNEIDQTATLATDPTELLLSRLNRVTARGDGWDAECPCHDDGKNSLCVSRGDDGKVLLHCQSGCETRDILQSVGLELKDLFPPAKRQNGKSNGKAAGWGEPTHEYKYHNAAGAHVFSKLRYRDKNFSLCQPDGKGGRVSGLEGITHKPLYRLPGLLKHSDKYVFVFEGEKDCDRANKEGFVSTTNYEGASKSGKKPKWLKRYSQQLEGRNIVVIPDNDEAGKARGEAIARMSYGLAESIRVLNLPELPLKGDFSDWMDAGGSREKLAQLVRETPLWEPAKPSLSPDTTSLLSEMDDDNVISNGTQPSSDCSALPIPMSAILDKIGKLTNGWPRRVGSAMFVHREGSPVEWLEKPAAMFGWLGTTTGNPPKFSMDSGLHTKAEVFAEQQRTATDYSAVEELPHEPKLRNHYYACSFPENGDGSKLRGLVERFSPETEIDLDLITALFVSAFWGAAGGTRPAFLVTANEGRGVGKTTLAAMLGYLCGGLIELSANESAEVIKQRLLSPAGIALRVALLDNVKSLRFSWADLEAMITAAVISGKRLYVGEAKWPNNLVWMITLNGASLATDLAQRCVIIKLKRPKHSGNWLEETRQYIDDNRQAIIGDILGFLRSERHELRQHSRWAAWERDILSRLPEPEEAQAVILERQGEANVEHEESEIIEQSFRDRLDSLNYNPDADAVFLPSSLISRWLSETMNDRISTTASSRMLRQKIDEGELTRLKVNKCNTYGRGFLWVGADANPDTTILKDIDHRLELLNRGQSR